MDKILITGAAGFIGSNLSYAFWKKGAQLVLIDDFSYGKYDNLVFADHDFRKDVIVMDVCNKQALELLFQMHNFDYIFHMAGITPLPDCQVTPAVAAEVNIVGTINILETARKFGIKKLLFASTSAIYENCVNFPTSENDVIPPSLIYSSTKFSAEHFCKSYYTVYGMDISVLRFANVYGPHTDCLRKQPSVLSYIIREFFYDRAPILHSTGEQKRDFIYIDDLINLALLAINGKGYDCLNVSSGESCSINELVQVVAQVMHKEHITPVYQKPSHYWNHYPELYEGVFPINEKIIENEVNKFTQCDNSYAKIKYQWVPQMSLKKGIEATIDYTLDMLSNEKSL